MRSVAVYTHGSSASIIGAAFLRNHQGAVCIAFADSTFVRADCVRLDRQTCAVRAVFDDETFFLGHVSEAMAEAFAESRAVLLTGIELDGTQVEHVAAIELE